ncbi:retrograde protein of 51 kDa-like isoform X1 [Haliotis rufescens]|uniref:retrograde protein of 51 kDa-like isoform X1 n=1 Tax=Haliotis rufescens TaxID=6454 RepID=UPI001EB0090F|nr:retrograde protein of 51 kDa-like isoform X1 [Haliotis rufescens]
MSVQQTTRTSSSTYTPAISARTTLVQRGSNTRSSHGGSGGGFSFSSRTVNPVYSPGTYQTLSSSGVTTVRESRQKEKKEMQGLNERLAGYIEQVRFLEARIKMLEDQLAQLGHREKFDLQPIRDMYEAELNQARKVIDELSKEKAGVDARIAGLQDEVQRQGAVIDILEKHKVDYVSKINQLTTQIGEYEGELGSLRLRIRNVEDENEKLRELLNRANDDLKKYRADLDTETAAHIEASNRAQTFEEECEFLRALLDKIPQETQQTTKIQGLDMRAWWDKQMAQAIRDLSSEYDNVVSTMRDDMEMRMNAQVRQLQSGAVRENLESAHLREEVKKLKANLSDRSSALNDAEARLRTLEAEMNDLARQLSEARRDNDELKLKYQTDVDRLQGELETCLQELQCIMDAKLSLELEICCYRQLLEGEENRAGLKQIVEQAVGVQGSGAQRLSEFITSSSSSSTAIGHSKGSKPSAGMNSEASGRMTQSRSSRGPISFVEASIDGSYIMIENTTSGSKGKNQDLSGWSLKRSVPGKKDVSYTFGNTVLKQGEKLRIYAAGNPPAHGDTSVGDFIINKECFSWGGGSGTTLLLDDSKNEKASLKSTISGLK